MDRRRAALLEAMGIERYVARPGSPGYVAPPSVEPTRTAEQPLAAGKPQGAASRPVAVPNLREAARPAPAAPVPVPVPDDVSGLDWAGLEARVSSCRRCALAGGRRQTVFGVGDRAARWFVVGEAPGVEEDLKGEPFVGAAGQMLDAMMAAIGQPRSALYIANVAKCHPPGNRDPSAEEAAACLPYLHRQIELVAPALVLCVGRIAAQNLLGVDTPIGQLRGKVHRLAAGDVPVVVTYHPAYLLRSPTEKRKAWADLKFAMEVARGRGA
jgi:DNA polymerase